MFRCKGCKAWLKSGVVNTEIENQSVKIRVSHLPVKICPRCGKVYFYDTVKQTALKYALEKKSDKIDFAECEAEASASQMVL